MSNLPLPSIPKSLIYDDGGSMTVEWQDFFYKLYKRVGGYSGEPWPVGSVFVSIVGTDPAELIGYGTWVSFGTGRVLIGIDPSNVDYDAAEETGEFHIDNTGATDIPYIAVYFWKRTA